MPAHHQIEEALDEYLAKADIKPGEPIFQSVTRAGTALTGRPLNRHNAWAGDRGKAGATRPSSEGLLSSRHTSATAWRATPRRAPGCGFAAAGERRLQSIASAAFSRTVY